MTIKELAAQLHTPEKDLRTWMEADNVSEYVLLKHTTEEERHELTEDGEAVLRHLHLSHTHPEVQQRINNLVQVIFDQRKEITKLENEIGLIRSFRKRGTANHDD